MTVISPFAQVGTLLIPAASPQLAPHSEGLAAAIRAVTMARPAEAGPLDLEALQVHGQEAAERLQAVRAALAQRASPDTIAAWLMHIVVAIGHPTDTTEILAKQRILIHPLDQLPAACITRRSAAKVAIAAGRWFPPLADIMRVVRPEAAALQHEETVLTALLRVIEGPAGSRPVATAAERAAMAAKGHQRAAELAAAAATTGAADRSIRAATLSPEDLARAYAKIAAEGGAAAPAARVRLAALREGNRRAR